MKNNTYKNLIFLASFAFFAFVGVNNVFANYNNAYLNAMAQNGYFVSEYNPNAVPTIYTNSNNTSYTNIANTNTVNPNTNQFANNTNNPVVSTKEPYKYIEPTKTQNNIAYLPENYAQVNQGTSTGYNNTQPRTLTSVNRANNANNDSGNYINFDRIDPNLLGASAYGLNNQIGPDRNTIPYNNNDLTALSIKGSGSFLPSSVFQWFILILLILGIVIVSRMIIKANQRINNNPLPR